MFIIRSNYGNNSLALIQWAHEQRLENVSVVYVDTGWAAAGWSDQIARGEAFAAASGFATVHLKAPMPFAELMLMKQGFPNRRYQWCSLHLKGIPFLNWVEDVDPHSKATVLIPRLNAEQRSETPATEFNDCCEYHGNRRVWQPLCDYSPAARDELLAHAELDPLPHSSQECAPCINSTLKQLRHLAEDDIAKTEELEEELEANLFDPARCSGSVGIGQVAAWAATQESFEPGFKFGCSAVFGCGA
jgi:hypothetical protein